MKTALASCLFVLALSHCSLARAEDAYDDEDTRPERPHEDDEDETGTTGPDAPLESGGLEAPGTLQEGGDKRTDIEKELDRSEEKDAGRGLEFFWISGDFGFQALGLATFSGSRPGDGTLSGTGLAYGGGLGLRVLYFTLGARFRSSSLGDFSPWSLLAEGGLRVPLGRFEPYGILGGGYIRVPNVGSGSIGGVDLRLGGGLDVYLSDSFSVGANVSGDLLLISSSGQSATGGALTTVLQVGLHF